MSERVGPVGEETDTIYNDPHDADVLFVGSSQIRVDIKTDLVEKSLSAHLGRPAHVRMLAMYWPGMDYQYFMLRDYFKRHKATLIVFNLPQQNGFTNEPHVQAYRWVRFGEYTDALRGLPLRYRIFLYGEMVLGAPRELLARIRPNLIGSDEMTYEEHARWSKFDPLQRLGFMGSPFVPDSLPGAAPGETFLQPANSPIFTVVGPKPGVYQEHFLRLIVNLAQQHGSKIVFIHMPQSFDYGETKLEELASWSKMFGPNAEIIAAPETVFFPEMDRQRYLHFFKDENHLNYNGEAWFTEKITPTIVKAYDEAVTRQPENQSAESKSGAIGR